MPDISENGMQYCGVLTRRLRRLFYQRPRFRDRAFVEAHGRKATVGLFSALITAGGVEMSGAEESLNWKAQFAGLDGVSISCMRNIERKYATRVCDALTKHAEEKLKEAEVAHEIVGTAYDRGFAPGKAATLKNPLNLTFHVRATNPGPLGMDVRMSASVTYNAAIQSHNGTTPRQGELLMWQNGVTSSATGGTRKLERAVVRVSKERMDEIVLLIDQNWGR